MLNTFIKNRGITSTIIRENNHSHINETKWDADYDGDVAHIDVATNNDGKINQYKINLDNEDLAHMLTLPSVNMPLEQRLRMDYGLERKVEPMRMIELPSRSSPSSSSQSLSPFTRISSPKSNEELIVPLTIDKDTMYRRHRRKKTHVTHKVYKKPKSGKTRSKRSSKSSL
jgi:hypothetical protein